jgi:hypothetical protein
MAAILGRLIHSAFHVRFLNCYAWTLVGILKCGRLNWLNVSWPQIERSNSKISVYELRIQPLGAIQTPDCENSPHLRSNRRPIAPFTVPLYIFACLIIIYVDSNVVTVLLLFLFPTTYLFRRRYCQYCHPFLEINRWKSQANVSPDGLRCNRWQGVGGAAKGACDSPLRMSTYRNHEYRPRPYFSISASSLFAQP